MEGLRQVLVIENKLNQNIFCLVWRDFGVSLGAEFTVSPSNHVGFTLKFYPTENWLSLLDINDRRRPGIFL